MPVTTFATPLRAQNPKAQVGRQYFGGTRTAGGGGGRVGGFGGSVGSAMGAGGSLPGGAIGASMPMAPTPPLTTVAQPIPELQQQQRDYQQGLAGLKQFASEDDPFLLEQIDELRKRKSADQTKRATDQSASAIRDQMAGLLEQGDEQGARQGRGSGFGAESIAEAGQRAQAGAAAQIQMGEQQRLDQLTLGGQGIMGAPGQRKMQAQALLADYLKANPAATAAQIGLQAQRLGLDQWALPQQLGIQYLQAQQSMLNPIFSMLGGIL